ncbi:hypothetical protein [Alkaliphilus peptidifermentans]|uniref:SPOR domain-containing protein n=1 Tax=Alkaliphilus peptidifermentans DSM 18978 TaxID=1120976 RepID=A0A1G5DP61_9FIRM|nr:hypothetical protein [Alkaliphilus peptidifermentans]SCY16549.1 hypothetical protein SAMN03080606_00971 [Alkaliphilus peptidifermentans DSM 18978]
MKKSRLKMNRRRRKSNIVLVFIFCIILPIMAIYIGLRVTEKWVSPALNMEFEDDDYSIDLEDILVDDNDEDEVKNVDNDDVEDVEMLVGEINSMSIFTIQVASLSDKDNIENLINNLNQQRLSYLVYQIEDSFKVYTHGFTRRPYVEEKLSEVREVFEDAYINEIHFPIKEIKFEKNNYEKLYKGTIENLNDLIDIMEKQSEAWYNNYEKEGDMDIYVELLKKQQSTLDNLSTDINENLLPQSFPSKNNVEKMIHYQRSNINRSLEIIEEDDQENLYRLHSLYLDSLFRIVEVIK